MKKIILHIIGWILFLSLPILLYRIEITDPYFLLKECINKLFLIGLFYLNYYLLIPAFFEKRNLLRYAACLMGCLLFLIFQQLLMEHYFLTHLFDGAEPAMRIAPFQNIVREAPKDTLVRFPAIDAPIASPVQGFITMKEPDFVLGVPKSLFLLATSNVISSSLLMISIGSFLRLYFSFQKQRDEKKALENANLNAEVNQLKSQINPHFLFNTLNSIYALAHKRSDKTERSIHRLSEIFRYVLYESGGEKIALSKDIQYITNYIELQRLRLSDKIRVDYQVEGSTEGLHISPLLLITFIENAFKYGVSYVHPGTIAIFIRIRGQQLELQVQNKMYPAPFSETGGIGLTNARRRLELLYNQKYNLDIWKEDEQFIVNLKMHL